MNAIAQKHFVVSFQTAHTQSVGQISVQPPEQYFTKRQLKRATIYMAKVNFTRTINPLQFDALEPKRFEDLVRQLLYDFRPWRQLEPTGRMGSDDGFDARGWEIQNSSITEAHDRVSEEQASPDLGDRIWLIQCKRETKIGPTKLTKYLDEIGEEDVENLHGIIIAACADFSKRSRDEFRTWCAKHGLMEFHLWGKAELEDALFQPKNDGLLFAYFGLSLTIRRRSEQARLRLQTTTKRKLKRAIEGRHEVIIRDVSDEDYPYRKTGDDEFRWWVFSRPRLTFRGLECLGRRYFAYIDNDRELWDFANKVDDAQLSKHVDPWRGHSGPTDERQELFAFWDALPTQNRAWLEVWGVIAFSRVLEVDDVGDDCTEHPHIYVSTLNDTSLPFDYDYPDLAQTDRWSGVSIYPKPKNRMIKFPDKFRKSLPKHLLDAADEDDDQE